ncbi:MAG: NAD-dependent dihydropyrimidine dehydrogenase subunit PreA [Eubacteriales bacterium]
MENLTMKLVTANEVARCMLCLDAGCSRGCTKGIDPARAIRALRFANHAGGAAILNRETCADCDAPCETACIHYDRPIRIQKIATSMDKTQLHTVDLSVDFCGIHCENPFFLSSSIVASGYDMCAKALEMGWAGLVYKTVGFYMPEEVSPRFDATLDTNRHFVGFKNMEQISDKPLEENFAILAKLKENFPTKIIVSSIMGQTDQEWTDLARMSQAAGVDMIECNFSCPHMSSAGLGCDVGLNPDLVAQYIRATKRGTTLPVLAKMTPNLANMEPPAMAAMQAGADGLAAINTVKSIAHVNHETMVSRPSVRGKSAVSGYSGVSVKPIALRFIHDMAVCPALKHAPISGMGGIETHYDTLDFLALGCGNVQITTAVMEYGYRIIDDLIGGLSHYMYTHNITSVQQLVGSGLENVIPADHLDRSSILYPKIDKAQCVGCKRCYVSCYDAGHQAIHFDPKGKAYFDPQKCVGCHLCKLVCPVRAISRGKRIPK